MHAYTYACMHAYAYVQVGDAIVKARLKPESIQIAWDFDRDGKVSRQEEATARTLTIANPNHS